MEEHADGRRSPRRRRVRPVYEGDLAQQQSARRGRLRAEADFTVRCTRDGERHVVAACGRLDHSSAWELERELRRAEASDAFEILVDLGGLEFIDSAGIEVVIHASARARHHSKPLMIAPGPVAVHSTFERSGLASRLPFVDSP